MDLILIVFSGLIALLCSAATAVEYVHRRKVNQRLEAMEAKITKSRTEIVSCELEAKYAVKVNVESQEMHYKANVRMDELEDKIRAAQENVAFNRTEIQRMDAFAKDANAKARETKALVEKYSDWAGTELGLVRSRVSDMEDKLAKLIKDSEPKQYAAEPKQVAKATKSLSKPRKVRV